MHGVYVLWWVQDKRVPVALVAAILAAGDFAVSVLELPTGWVADRFGHRVSLIVGSILQVAGMVCAWLGRGTIGLLAASLLIAAGDAFRSGADQGLLYRSCIALGDASFQRREAHARALQLAALVVLVLAGGAIVDRLGFDAGWLAETLLCSVGLGIACAMVEPPRGADRMSVEPTFADHDAVVRDDTSSRRSTRAAMFALVVPTSALVAAASAGLFLVQSDVETGAVGMTAFVAASTLAEAAGAFAAARVSATRRVRAAVTGAGVALSVLAVAVPGAFYPALAAAFFLMGLAEPLRAAAIQRVAADRARARAASLASACDKILTTVTLIMVGGAPRRPR